MTKTAHSQQEYDQQTIDDWQEETGASTIDMIAVAKWAMSKGLYNPKPHDPVREYARRLSRAARAQHYIDPQGREVRKKHCFKIIDEKGQYRWHWVDITTANPDNMQMAFQQRRQSALGDVVQLNKDVQSYNENNMHGVQLEFDYNFDEDLEELKQPTDYPDED